MQHREPHTETLEKEGFDAREIANAVLLKARAINGGDKLTAMQLIKLVYLVHGWSLALRGKSLVRNRPEAWQFGPVYPRIYKQVKGKGRNAVTDLLVDADGDVFYPHGISPKEELVVDHVLKSYGNKSAFSLSSITHKTDTPWDYTQKNLGLYQDIPEDEMMSHFNQLVDERKIDKTIYQD
ncbi:Panacea domain-containing protein [Litorimonas sp. WD9-15]|uniref:Panacea domain-containing protein n=1 Tax=Litorimonas sp. WD9-15 TaxID=3418716 RepID=UPI003CFE4828